LSFAPFPKQHRYSVRTIDAKYAKQSKAEFLGLKGEPGCKGYQVNTDNEDVRISRSGDLRRTSSQAFQERERAVKAGTGNLAPSTRCLCWWAQNSEDFRADHRIMWNSEERLRGIRSTKSSYGRTTCREKLRCLRFRLNGASLLRQVTRSSVQS
jgi:hypothetical protein